MSVEIEPFELSFQRPFVAEVAQTLTIKNPNTVPVAFKVKTTAPKQYCVRPNAGRIEPGKAFDVTVLLQAMKTEPPADARCRDKFLVQSAPITSDKEFASIANVLDTTDKALLQERKIRVNWLSANPEHDQSASRPMAVTPSKNSLSNGAHETPEVPRAFSSPGATDETSPSTAPPPYPTEDTPVQDEEPEEKPEAKSTISQATTAVTSAAEATVDALKAELAQAEAQIAALKETGLRQRNVKSASVDDEKRAVAKVNQAVKQTVEGVPVQIAALLCLISFLLAYFFF
ncbi:PapD-like protein [Ilyonectria robusta]|uniref:PapD-like protein n=1 Tax=Ilyonectria robusta TaxID=1079257 RepID=UPI001E8CFDAF|nr:PapD-like protein [Ilyonectria robusta]KAH8673006.1 PapD-like protein [Ilyonectria robusta]